MMDEQPIYKAEQSHTGGHLCPHAHRTYMSAYRCLPASRRRQALARFRWRW